MSPRPPISTLFPYTTLFRSDQDRMREYLKELADLGIELKDFDTGLIDFPCWLDDREVCLCWRLGEPTIEHWHEIDAGFAGRRRDRKSTRLNSSHQIISYAVF